MSQGQRSSVLYSGKLFANAITGKETAGMQDGNEVDNVKAVHRGGESFYSGEVTRTH